MTTPAPETGPDPDRQDATGAVRLDAATREEAAASSEAGAQAARVEAEARGEEIEAEVARTDRRRAEEETANAADRVEQAERERRDAEQAQKDAQAREQRVRADADDARQRAADAGDGQYPHVSARSGFAAGPGGQPIVFGPFTADRPELLVAAALVGGLILARLIRGMGSK